MLIHFFYKAHDTFDLFTTNCCCDLKPSRLLFCKVLQTNYAAKSYFEISQWLDFRNKLGEAQETENVNKLRCLCQRPLCNSSWSHDSQCHGVTSAAITSTSSSCFIYPSECHLIDHLYVSMHQLSIPPPSPDEAAHRSGRAGWRCSGW